MEEIDTALQFIPFSSCINPSFWFKLTQLKLDVYKLDDTAESIWGYYSNVDASNKAVLEVDSTSFNSDHNGSLYQLPYQGLVFNKNTIERFKNSNKSDVMHFVGKILQQSIKVGDVILNPSLLNYFFILSFADIKQYKFYYWFGFPAVHSLKPTLVRHYSVETVFNEKQLKVLCDMYQELSTNDKPFFIVSKRPLEILTLSTKVSIRDISTNVEDYDELLFAFADPTTRMLPGWPIRNYILCLLFFCPNLHGKTVKFLSFRLNRKGPGIICKNSVVFELVLPTINIDTIFPTTENIWYGYEANERGKMGPRFSNLKQTLSPESIIDSFVDLNLRLMKWRVLPTVNLEKIKNTKCLLLGAGTLGCNVARNLMAWGVRTITFVDSGHVSYTNPIRQNLYTFADCAAGKEKAQAAAENLLKIYPNMVSKGYNFTIPMPGHPVSESLLKQTKEAYVKLDQLISEHDMIFLLTDSRESRWLPTLMCTSLKKTVINAALGFDSYLVMRHGVRTETPPEALFDTRKYKCVGGDDLGCYFCNDITAPGDSLKDRTLDQQCTVTRPGVSNIAGALAVELAMSVLQHEKGPSAPVFLRLRRDREESCVSYDDECCLGIVPHSIRGFLSGFNSVLPATARYKQCVACSEEVVERYEQQKFEFVLKVCSSPSYLEEVTGLNKMTVNEKEIVELDTTDDDGSNTDEVPEEL